jgi:pimeloyl-ACP methyl ester carboxylesterase
MKTELITIETSTTPLDGAYYEPDDGPIQGSVLLLHGNTMNFYTGAPRFLPPALTRMGLACLAFNRRGHDVLSIRNSRTLEGAAFQTTSESIEDNNLAAAWMAKRGYAAPIVIGHSNGGMLAVQHVHDHPETPALVLLSAIAGGADSSRVRKQDYLGGERTQEILAVAKNMMAEGCGDELMFVPGWWYVISAASFIDRTTTVPSILALAPCIRTPTLFIRGDQESPKIYPAEAFAEAAAGPCEAMVFPDCDHFYNGQEGVVCARVTAWRQASRLSFAALSKNQETARS